VRESNSWRQGIARAWALECAVKLGRARRQHEQAQATRRHSASKVEWKSASRSGWHLVRVEAPNVALAKLGAEWLQ